MTGLVRKAILFAGCGVLIAGSAMANVPSAANSSFTGSPIPGGSPDDDGFYVVAKCVTGDCDIAQPSPPEDALGQFSVTVRDAGNVLLAGVVVTADFNACTDFRLAQNQTFPGVSILCGSKVVSATTNALGVASFRILGGALNPAPAVTGATGTCVELRASNVFLRNVRAAAFDQDGLLNGVGGGDLSLLLADILPPPAANPNFTRSDYSLDGAVGGGDLSIWLSDFFSSRGDSDTAPACP
jgi:hypothetical protein